MAEGHRLAARNADLRYVGRFIDCRQSGHQGDQQDDAAENADFRKGIGTGMEYLAHSSSIDRKSAVGLREIKFADRLIREIAILEDSDQQSASRIWIVEALCDQTSFF